jgi:hypothetical protein
MAIEPLSFDVLEQATGQFTATVVGNDGVTALPGATLSTLALTLYVIKTDGTIAYVNTRNAQNVLNANNVTVSAAGLVTWTLQVADTTLVEVLPFERHIALWEWTWPAGAGKYEVIFVVKNLTEVP